MAEEHLENGVGKISYTVRELLAEIRATVASIDAKLDTKADKTIVDTLVTRVNTLETLRGSDQQYGNQLIAEFRNLLTEHTQVLIDIATLKQNKKDKDSFNVLWIPVCFNFLGVVALIYFSFIR
jgi:hypothetical protein